MAFSIRKMISMISSRKSEEEKDIICNDPVINIRRSSPAEDAIAVEFEHTEPDSTSRQPKGESPKILAAKKGSLSDTDMKKGGKKRKAKKLKIDVDKANHSLDGNLKKFHDSESESENENTPKRVYNESKFDIKSTEAFTQRLRQFNFSSNSIIVDSDDESSPYEEENLDVLSFSESDVSLASDEPKEIKMCRKVEDIDDIMAQSPAESFGDVETEKNEEERVALLSKYQTQFGKFEEYLKTILGELQFHIEVSKIFNARALTPDQEGSEDKETLNHGVSPESWNIVVEKEDLNTKNKLRSQLLMMANTIDQFINSNLILEKQNNKFNKESNQRRRFNIKKKQKYFDFPDYRDALINLFEETVSDTSIDDKCSCVCQCHNQTTETDSGVTTKSDEHSTSVTSSLGNFTLDSTTLSAYSDTLDQIISYNSFQDQSLYTTLLQKPAIERITFYVQVHSILLKSEASEDNESKDTISFHCPSCSATEFDENGLLKHIFGLQHGEKLHFLYKTAYIKKCVQEKKEIQPSTVLNPMKLYRDDNKIVCFGDTMYACSLCFENLIVGESVLMGHISEPEHIDRREKLNEMFE